MFRRKRQEQDLKDELEFHLTRLGQSKGAFGGEDRVAEECRDGRRWAWLESGARDLRYGWRSLRRKAGWTAVMVATLALGIGATVVAFSLVYAALLRPLPYVQAQQLVWISARSQRLGISEKVLATQKEMTAWAPELERLFSAYARLGGGGVGSIWNVNGRAVIPLERSASASLFSMLGVRPLYGRLLELGDERDGAPSVAVLGYDFWRTEFGGNTSVIGKVMTEWDGNPAGTRIVGVLPPSFKLEQATDLWRPTRPIHSSADFPVYFLLGRRRADVSLAAVQTAMSGLERRNPPPVYAWRGPDPEWKPQVETLARAGSRGRCDDRCCCCWRRRGACCCWAASTWRTCWWRATISGGANLGCGWRWAVRRNGWCGNCWWKAG